MDIPTHAELVDRIDRFMARHDMAPTRLGREATGEPNLIPSIKAGRQPNLDTLNKLGRLMADYDARLPAAPEHVDEWPIGAANNDAEIICADQGPAPIDVDEGAAGEGAPRPFAQTSSRTGSLAEVEGDPSPASNIPASSRTGAAPEAQPKANAA